MSLEEAATRAADAVRRLPKGSRWFLASDSDADGLSAAAVMAVALRRAGHRFVVRASRDKDGSAYRAILAHESDGWMFLDKATSHAALIGALATAPVVIIDHHNVVDAAPDNVVLVNPRVEGMDGSRDACSSTTAVAVALAMDAGNVDLAAAALAGAVGDWQHRGGWQGWNLELIERGKAAGVLVERLLPRLAGSSLAAALANRDPPIPTLQGDVAAATDWLSRLGLDPAADADDLGDAERTRLVSALALLALSEGVDPDSLQLVAPQLASVRHDATIRQLYRVVDACGREGRPDAGVAHLMGDASVLEEARGLFETYRRTIRDGVEALAASPPERRGALQVAWTKRAGYTGMIGGIGMTHVLPDRTIPLATLAHREDGLVQMSGRGSHELVRRGLDLGLAIREAAATVGAEGGGHPNAAGVVLAADKVDAFLDALDAGLMKQGFLEEP